MYHSDNLEEARSAGDNSTHQTQPLSGQQECMNSVPDSTNVLDLERSPSGAIEDEIASIGSLTSANSRHRRGLRDEEDEGGTLQPQRPRRVVSCSFCHIKTHGSHASCTSRHYFCGDCIGQYVRLWLTGDTSNTLRRIDFKSSLTLSEILRQVEDLRLDFYALPCLLGECFDGSLRGVDLGKVLSPTVMTQYRAKLFTSQRALLRQKVEDERRSHMRHTSNDRFRRSVSMDSPFGKSFVPRTSSRAKRLLPLLQATDEHTATPPSPDPFSLTAGSGHSEINKAQEEKKPLRVKGSQQQQQQYVKLDGREESRAPGAFSCKGQPETKKDDDERKPGAFCVTGSDQHLKSVEGEESKESLSAGTTTQLRVAQRSQAMEGTPSNNSPFQVNDFPRKRDEVPFDINASDGLSVVSEQNSVWTQDEMMKVPGPPGFIFSTSTFQRQESAILQTMCQCCYSNTVNVVECNDSHCFCSECVRTYVSQWLFRGASYSMRKRKDAGGSLSLPCLVGECSEGYFDDFQIEKVISPLLLREYHEKLNKIVEFDGEPNQGRRNEEKLSTTLNSSFNLGAQEGLLDHHHQIEEAVTMAKVRQCPKCEQKFLKDNGYGNKLRCPSCRTFVCYICGEEVSKIEYDHFCTHEIGGCSTCGTCPLWSSDDNVRDRARIKKAALEVANRLWEEALLNPDAPEFVFDIDDFMTDY